MGDLHERIRRLPDAQLVDVIESNSQQYTEEALRIAWAEAEARGGLSAVKSRLTAVPDPLPDPLAGAGEPDREDMRSEPITSRAPIDADRLRKIRAVSIFHFVVFGLFLANSLLQLYGHTSIGSVGPMGAMLQPANLGRLSYLTNLLLALVPVDVSLLMILLSTRLRISRISPVGYAVLAFACFASNLTLIAVMSKSQSGGDWLVPLLAYTLLYSGAIVLPVIWLGSVDREPIVPYAHQSLGWFQAVLFFPVTAVRTTMSVADKLKSNNLGYYATLLVGLSIAAFIARVVLMLIVLGVMVALVIVAILIALWIIGKFFEDDTRRKHIPRPAYQPRVEHALSAGHKVFNRNWEATGHISDDGRTVYDRDWRTTGHISDDGSTVYDKDWNVTGHVSDDRKTMYDKDWRVAGRVSDDGRTIYDKDWNVSGHSLE